MTQILELSVGGVKITIMKMLKNPEKKPTTWMIINRRFQQRDGKQILKKNQMEILEMEKTTPKMNFCDDSSTDTIQLRKTISEFEGRTKEILLIETQRGKKNSSKLMSRTFTRCGTVLVQHTCNGSLRRRRQRECGKRDNER